MKKMKVYSSSSSMRAPPLFSSCPRSRFPCSSLLFPPLPFSSLLIPPLPPLSVRPPLYSILFPLFLLSRSAGPRVRAPSRVFSMLSPRLSACPSVCPPALCVISNPGTPNPTCSTCEFVNPVTPCFPWPKPCPPASPASPTSPPRFSFPFSSSAPSDASYPLVLLRAALFPLGSSASCHAHTCRPHLTAPPLTSLLPR